jgi:hypothetical protein
MLNEWWGVVCEIGFWGWISSAIGLTLTAFPSGSVFDAERARWWGIPLVILYLIWIAGMLNG